MPSQKPVPSPRRRGRPPKVSRERVIDVTLRLLEDVGPDEISMADVAAGLGVSVMTLYNHFPNISELLQAVADHTFGLFELPPMAGDEAWQSELMTWLRALARHCERHPVALRIVSIEGRTTPAWQRIMEPLLEMLHALDVREEEAALLLAWITSQAMGLIYIEEFAEPARRLGPRSLDPVGEHREWLGALNHYLPTVRREQVLELGFQSLVMGLERQLVQP